MIEIINPDELINFRGTFYSVDRRLYENKPPRKSIIEDYDRIKRLEAINQLSNKDIYSSKYSQRIEFRLAKYNCQYRTLNNLKGTGYEVMFRYTPYLAVLFNRHLRKNVLINPKDHPYFSNILLLSEKDIKRYTGTLEKYSTHETSSGEEMFFNYMFSMQMNNSGYSIEKMISDITNGNYGNPPVFFKNNELK
jgi:hypothetical protein